MNKDEDIKKKEKNNKKKLLIVLLISCLVILGGTLAYFTTSNTITNAFKTALYQHTIVEVFESPSDWTPGTTTEKTVEVTNTGSVSMAVRASYTESWVNANGDEISLTDSDGNVAAIISFGSDWVLDQDGYYYYGSKSNLTELLINETSSSFIESVTFNEAIESTLNTEVSNDGQTITVTSSGSGYDNATYTLTIKIDTIQYDQALNVW